MKSLGHTIFHYGGPESEAECHEYIQCITLKDQIAIREFKHFIYPSWDPRNPIWIKYNSECAKQIAARIAPKDIICVLGGTVFEQLANEFPLNPTVEIGIGYFGYKLKYKVWESNEWKQFVALSDRIDKPLPEDPIIHGFYNPAEFNYEEQPEDFLLFIGRITEFKGIQWACEAAERAGRKLLVAGHGNKKLVTNGAYYLGEVTKKERNRLMGLAKAVLCPTTGFEPFGNVACEAQMSGCPVISTDWGGYKETVIDGATGWRCNSVDSIVKAISKLSLLDSRRNIKESAIKRFSMDNKKHEYIPYFERITAVC